MNVRFYIAWVTLVSATSAQAWAQAPDVIVARHSFTSPVGAWGAYDYDYYRGGSTPIGDAARGAAAVIRSSGEAVRNASEAAINIETAKSQYLRNNYDAAKTYWDKRLLWTENSARERGTPLSSEQLRQIARESAPARLTALQLSPATGEINWPAALRAPEFASLRSSLNSLFANRTVSNSGVGSDTESTATRLTNTMQERLRSQIDELTPNEYVGAKNFLRSLAYEARFMPGVEGVARR